jgi:YD repeat-containing protein
MRVLSRLKHQLIAAVVAAAAATGTTSYAPSAQAAPLPVLTCTPPATDPEIGALARALQYNLNLIYEYVYYNIDYSPTWGSKKGALGTYLDRRGNGIDQNTLFVELLRQSCITANYRFGALSMPTSEIANNLGVANSAGAVETVLAKGGFSGSVTADVTTVNRVWTEVQLNGVTYELDPSLKSYARYTPIDLGQTMGYSRDSLLSAVTGGSTAVPGAPAGVNTIKGVNRSQLTTQLNTYSGKLADYIKNNHPSASTAQIYGGRGITNDFYGASLPVAGTLYSTLPASFETVYTIAVSDSADGSNPTINKTVYASQIAGRRLTLTYNGSQPVLSLDGVVLGTGAATGIGSQTVAMTVQHPYPAGNSFSTWSVKPVVKTGGAYALMLVAGELGRDTLTRHQKAIARYIQSGQTGEPATGEALAAIGTAYLSQSDQAAQFSANYFGFVDVRHAAMGIAGKTTSAYVDFPGQTSSISPYASSMTTDELVAASIGLGIFNSTLESTAVSQLQKDEAVSTVRMFDYANNDGTGFVEATNANWNQVQPLLTGWAAADKAQMGAFLQANSATGRLFIAQNGSRKVGKWTGSGWYQFNTTGNVSNMSYLISGGYFGGYGAGTNPFSNVTASAYTSPATNQFQLPSPKSGEPVDMYSGAYLYDHTDIDVGTGEFPFKLAFKRSYNSNNAANPTALGNGWRHNFMMSAMVDSDSFLAFGADNPRAAAPSAVMAYVLKDLVSTASPSLTNTVVASLSASWMMDQLVDNAVTLNLDSGSKKFVKIPTANGYTYVPPPGDASVLQVSTQAVTSITLTDKFKNVYQFLGTGPLAPIMNWSNPNSGTRVDFTYNGTGPDKTLASINNSTYNTKLTFTYNGSKLASVSNGTASVSFTYNGDNLTGVTDQASNTTRYTYDGANRLASIFYPSFPSTAAVTNTYDPLGQMKLQADAFGNTWNYLFANGQRSTEIDPTGAGWTLYYDKNGNNIEDIDQVGNHTVYVYDGVGRRVRTN